MHSPLNSGRRHLPRDSVYDPFPIPDIHPAIVRARIEEARRQQARYLLHLLRNAGQRLAHWLHLPPPSALRHS